MDPPTRGQPLNNLQKPPAPKVSFIRRLHWKASLIHTLNSWGLAKGFDSGAIRNGGARVPHAILIQMMY